MHETVRQFLATQGLSADAFASVPGRPRVRTGSVPGSIAVPLWQALSGVHGETGVWPVIRGPDELYDEVDDFEADGTPPPGEGITARELLAERLAAQREVVAEVFGEMGADAPPDDVDLDTLARLVDTSGMNSSGGPGDPGAWPAESPERGLDFYAVTDSRTGKPHARVSFSLVESARPHDVVVHLGFGGWNDAPPPDLQRAVLGAWGTAYGAVPACVSNDVLECFVARPPQTEADALRLAAEQWIFCDDIVGQGTETVRRLAMEIWRSPKWFFWWD